MSLSKRYKRRNTVVLAGLATAAALAGGVGVASAGSPSGPPDPAATSSQSESTEPAAGSEQQESARLASQAKVSQADAEKAALSAVPGTVTSAELGNENGSIVWDVTVKKADASSVDVKVDAGNGKVLAQESERGEQDGSDEAGETTSG